MLSAPPLKDHFKLLSAAKGCPALQQLQRGVALALAAAQRGASASQTPGGGHFERSPPPRGSEHRRASPSANRSGSSPGGALSAAPP
jgi:hypothetical protein